MHLAGYGGQAADSAEAFEGIDSTLLLITLARRHRDPAVHLPQPDPVAAADLLRRRRPTCIAPGVVYLLAKYADLTVNGQSQAILSILVIGAGTDYALLLVARYREELRRHEDRHEAMAFALHRAAPAIFASAGTVVVGMLCLSFADLNSTAGLGPVLAIGVARHPAGDGDAAAGAAGDLRPLGLLAQAPGLRHRRAHRRRLLGPRRPRDQPRAAPGLGRPPRSCWSPALGLFRLDASGLSTEDSYTKEFDSIKGQALLADHGLADNSNTVQVVTNADQAAEVAGRWPGVDGLGEPRRQPIVDGRVAFEAPSTSTRRHHRRPSTSSRRCATAVHAVDGRRRAGRRRSALYLDTRAPPTRDGKVIIPVILIVVLLILMLLLRAWSRR